jgi:hypothetical protein
MAHGGRPHEIPEDLARRIVGLQYQSGLGARGIAQVLDRSGIRAPRGGDHWQPASVGNVLREAGVQIPLGRQPAWLPGWEPSPGPGVLHRITAWAWRHRAPGTGSDLAALMVAERPVAPVWVELDAAFGILPHAVIGAVACNSHMPPRYTSDIDFAIAVADSERTVSQLEAAGWVRTGELALRPPLTGWAWKDARGRGVEVIAVPGNFGVTLVEAAQEAAMGGLPLAGLAHLVTLKMLAARAQDAADISRMMGHQDQFSVETVRSVVTKVLGRGEIEDLDQLIELGRLEYGIVGENGVARRPAGVTRELG